VITPAYFQLPHLVAIHGHVMPIHVVLPHKEEGGIILMRLLLIGLQGWMRLVIMVPCILCVSRTDSARFLKSYKRPLYKGLFFLPIHYCAGILGAIDGFLIIPEYAELKSFTER
jgi:hypothetical protein